MCIAYVEAEYLLRGYVSRAHLFRILRLYATTSHSTSHSVRGTLTAASPKHSSWYFLFRVFLPMHRHGLASHMSRVRPRRRCTEIAPPRSPFACHPALHTMGPPVLLNSIIVTPGSLHAPRHSPSIRSRLHPPIAPRANKTVQMFSLVQSSVGGGLKRNLQALPSPPPGPPGGPVYLSNRSGCSPHCCCASCTRSSPYPSAALPSWRQCGRLGYFHTSLPHSR